MTIDEGGGVLPVEIKKKGGGAYAALDLER